MHFVDLSTQYSHIKSEIDQAIQDVLSSSQFIKGPVVQRFESNLASYLGCNHVISCANGTDALQIALMALDLNAGDEVIVPSFTYVATAEVIALLNLTPIMVDVDPNTFNITPQIIERAISDRTRVIVPVNLFGQCCDLDPIMALAKQYDLYVIEDNAQSIGAEYTWQSGDVQQAGTIAHMGTTSFFPSKNLGCYGDGGAMFTNDDEIAERLRKIANHGQGKRYYHDMIGVNSRLDAIQAAILDVKLGYLDQYIAARQEAARCYDVAFSELHQVRIPVRLSFSTHVFHQYTLQVLDGHRDALAAYLRSQDIPVGIYYPLPLYRQQAYSQYVDSDFSLPVTEDLCRSVLSLPMHTEMTPVILDRIISAVKRFYHDKD